MNTILTLETPRLVTCHFYNAYFNLPHSRHFKSIDSSNLREFSILHFDGSASGHELESMRIPGLDPTLPSHLDLVGPLPLTIGGFYCTFTINQAKELVMTECCLIDSDWEILNIFLRLHPQLRVVNAWDLSVVDLPEVGSRIQGLLEHCKLDMQSMEVLRFSCTISSFVSIFCEDDQEEITFTCSCDGCIHFPDMDYDQRREVLEELVGNELEGHIDGLFTSLPHLNLIEWWFDGPGVYLDSRPSIFWEWRIVSACNGRKFERRVRNWDSKSSLLPVDRWDVLRGMSNTTFPSVR